MDFGDKCFDLVIFRGVLQYVPNPKSYLRKAVSILNNNNSKKTGVPVHHSTAQCTIRGVSAIWKEFYAAGHRSRLYWSSRACTNWIHDQIRNEKSRWTLFLFRDTLCRWRKWFVENGEGCSVPPRRKNGRFQSTCVLGQYDDIDVFSVICEFIVLRG